VTKVRHKKNLKDKVQGVLGTAVVSGKSEADHFQTPRREKVMVRKRISKVPCTSQTAIHRRNYTDLRTGFSRTDVVNLEGKGGSYHDRGSMLCGPNDKQEVVKDSTGGSRGNHA